ncbi:MAG: hypothetical protein CVU90_04865 [Firmicutes bacterium HGW-Firmicutes-15]|nr:MAG: hypothetical protein CVU90_04865 [Firmicutes bacterium HGW-Firmicutes-15]
MRRKKIPICLSLTILLVFLLTSVVLANNILADQQTGVSINKAVNYLHSIQNNDGGFPGKAGGPSSMGTCCWVIMALEAGGEDVTSNTWAPTGLNPINYLSNLDNSLESTNDYARLLLALSAAQQSPVFQNINLAEKIISFQQSDGQFAQPLLKENGFINSHLWSILALTSAGCDIPNKESAKKWLKDRQNIDGGFGWAEGIASDSDDTGIAIQTLVILGEDPKSSAAIKNAINYLNGCQDEDGGFNSGNDWMSSGSNASSSAWVLQGLIAAGENPLGEGWSKSANNPVSYLLNLQTSDGFYNWKSDVISSPATITAQTIMALAQKPFPINIEYCSKNESLPSDKREFSDLSANNWAYQPIMNLVKAGLLSGYSDGTFKPDNSVSRAEFTRYIVSGLGIQEIKISEVHDFPDVTKDHWAYNFILITAEIGYVAGMPDGTFNPEGKINGAELATMIVKALPTEKKAQLKDGPFWYSGYVELAEKNGLLYPDFQPAISTSRSQCAYSIMQLRNLINRN